MAMNVLEKEIEDIVFESLENNPYELAKRGFPVRLDSENSRTFYLRQYNLGSYGIADIIGVSLFRHTLYNRITITIYELKKEQIGASTLTQALRYAKGIERLIKRVFPKKRMVDIAFEFVLVGKSVSTNEDWIYMADYFEDLTLVSFSVDLVAGVKFTKHSDYKIMNDMVGDLTKRAKLKYIESLRYFIMNPEAVTDIW